MDDVGDGSAETASEERVQQLLIYPDKRVVEIAPDGTVVAQESRAPNDPSLYLRDASRALRDCGSAPALYAGWRAEDRGGAAAGYAYRDAPQRRIEFSRTSILFASFAAEAFVNEFLAKRLGGNYTSEMERMRTIDKYVQLVPTISPSITIVRGRQPGQGLARLFRVRNHLVHPKSNAAPKDAITPPLAADCLVAASEAARMLTTDLGETNIYALLFSKYAHIVRKYARHSLDHLPDLNDAAPAELLIQLANREIGPQLARIARRQRQRPDPGRPAG